MKEQIGVNTRDKRADHCQHKENNKACGISDQAGYGRNDECEQSAGNKQFAAETMGTSPVVFIRERPWKQMCIRDRSDDELVVAFLDMVENHKMVVENSGLLTVAALKHLNVEGKKIVSVLSGGNMDVITMASVVQHGLIQRDRIFTISVLLPDRPGELVRVASVIAEEQGNVIKLEHNQFVSTNRNAAVELTITLEAFGTDHKMRIIKALKEHGYNPVQKVASL